MNCHPDFTKGWPFSSLRNAELRRLIREQFLICGQEYSRISSWISVALEVIKSGMDPGEIMTIDEYFDGQGLSKRIFDRLRELVLEICPAKVRVTTSQVAFVGRKAFLWVWMPEKYLRRKAAALVLTVGFPQKDPSPRWKEIVEPTPGNFVHHLELYSLDDLDDQVRQWIAQAWQYRGNSALHSG
jgi:hypothetical protein